MVKAGAARCAARVVAISADDSRGMSPGIVIIPALPLADEQASRSRDGAGMAFPRAFRDYARAVTSRKRCRGRIDRHDEHAGKLRDRRTQRRAHPQA